MGTDIQMNVERLDGNPLTWTYCEPPEIKLWDNTDGTPYMAKDWYWGRNYNLFAMLADVRNGYGVAGDDTGDAVEPISMPRGLPNDVSPEIRKEWNEDWGHNASWFSLRELQLVDWENNRITHRGVASPGQYLIFKKEGQPHSWSGGVGGGNIEHISNAEMDALLAGPRRDEVIGDGGHFSTYYTAVEWTTSWAEAAGPEWFEFLDRLKELARDDDSDVRAVFWFDS